MGESEIKIFIILTGIIVLVFITGIIIFIFQYRERKLLYNKEKAMIEEQHQSDLLNKQLEIRQQTMQFIGRELHDSVTQKLTLASIYTQQMEFENLYPGMQEKLKGISTIINDSLVELRDLSKSLTESKIENSSLSDLLMLECERVNDTGICRALLQTTGEAPLTITVKSFLLRTMQEFIQNSLKHSNCREISIRLRHDEKGLALNAADDGKGFDVTTVQSRGIGLNNMRRRIQILGGSFNLQSEAGRGTSLELFVPIDHVNSQ
ncbi:MAG TPA: ATP-binding protein [Ferruginibacter sp.]|nr:ATP-binding protein [Ferruginibacter sp.]